MSAVRRDAYLARLGLEPEPPSVAALFRIQRAHVERVPWETLWIHLGDRWSIDLGESTARIATTPRGGYCFHLNGALGELLAALGYTVVRHVGGVHGPGGPTAAAMTNHLVLTVHDLPDPADPETNPDGAWYVDAGLGDALYEPLPLVPGTYRQGPFQLGLERIADGVGDWHLTHDPAGSFVGMAWRAEPAAMTAFAERNAMLSSAPDSPFVNTLIVQRRDATGVDVLRRLTFSRVGSDAPAAETITSLARFLEILRDSFGIDLDMSAEARDALWQRVRAAHEAWKAAGG